MVKRKNIYRERENKKKETKLKSENYITKYTE